MTTLITPRLRLEPFKNSHFEELYYLNSDFKVMQYITGRTVSLEETIEHMELVKKNWTNLGFSSWSFIERESNEFIGTGGFQYIEFNPANPIEIGWRLKTSKWNQGFATEAAKHMTQFIFNKINIDCLYALCHQENKLSERVMQRLGMDYFGIEQWYGLDVSVYKMTRAWYEQNHVLSNPLCHGLKLHRQHENRLYQSK
jgi:RimJ/RimL family protein N-acetyltransferase